MRDLITSPQALLGVAHRRFQLLATDSRLQELQIQLFWNEIRLE
jgi:hypothetical protein